MHALKKCWIAAALCATLGAAQAQLLVGQTAGFTGQVAAGVKEASDGAKLYIDMVNTKGGVNGQKIELIALDDKFDPKLAAENARKLIEENNVLALFPNRGTPTPKPSSRCWTSMGCRWWAHPPGPWCCTSQCASMCSTCAPPTSVKPKRP